MCSDSSYPHNYRKQYTEDFPKNYNEEESNQPGMYFQTYQTAETDNHPGLSHELSEPSNEYPNLPKASAKQDKKASLELEERTIDGGSPLYQPASYPNIDEGSSSGVDAAEEVKQDAPNKLKYIEQASDKPKSLKRSHKVEKNRHSNRVRPHGSRSTMRRGLEDSNVAGALPKPDYEPTAMHEYKFPPPQSSSTDQECPPDALLYKPQATAPGPELREPQHQQHYFYQPPQLQPHHIQSSEEMANYMTRYPEDAYNNGHFSSSSYYIQPFVHHVSPEFNPRQPLPIQRNAPAKYPQSNLSTNLPLIEGSPDSSFSFSPTPIVNSPHNHLRVPDHYDSVSPFFHPNRPPSSTSQMSSASGLEPRIKKEPDAPLSDISRNESMSGPEEEIGKLTSKLKTKPSRDFRRSYDKSRAGDSGRIRKAPSLVDTKKKNNLRRVASENLHYVGGYPYHEFIPGPRPPPRFEEDDLSSQDQEDSSQGSTNFDQLGNSREVINGYDSGLPLYPTYEVRSYAGLEAYGQEHSFAWAPPQGYTYTPGSAELRSNMQAKAGGLMPPYNPPRMYPESHPDVPEEQRFLRKRKLPRSPNAVNDPNNRPYMPIPGPRPEQMRFTGPHMPGPSSWNYPGPDLYLGWGNLAYRSNGPHLAFPAYSPHPFPRPAPYNPTMEPAFMHMNSAFPPNARRDMQPIVNNHAHLEIIGDLNSVSRGWTPEDKKKGRKLVRFQGQQEGYTITLQFKVIEISEYEDGQCVVSCIYDEKNDSFFITSVDCIAVLSMIMNQVFSVDEKNRIRRNLEVCKPITVSKSNADTQKFFRLIMDFPKPRPRHIEKDVKVFHWENLESALKNIVPKYTPKNYSARPFFLPSIPQRQMSPRI